MRFFFFKLNLLILLLYYSSLFTFLEKSVHIYLEKHPGTVMHLGVQVINFCHYIDDTLGYQLG